MGEAEGCCMADSFRAVHARAAWAVPKIQGDAGNDAMEVVVWIAVFVLTRQQRHPKAVGTRRDAHLYGISRYEFVQSFRRSLITM